MFPRGSVCGLPWPESWLVAVLQLGWMCRCTISGACWRCQLRTATLTANTPALLTARRQGGVTAQLGDSRLECAARSLMTGVSSPGVLQEIRDPGQITDSLLNPGCVPSLVTGLTRCFHVSSLDFTVGFQRDPPKPAQTAACQMGKG